MSLVIQWVGTQETFGVEFRVESTSPSNPGGSAMGNARIWCENECLGTFEDLVYLDGYVLVGLLQILQVPRLEHLRGKSAAELFSIFCANDDAFLIHFGTFCDDFTIYAHLVEDKVVLTWQLWRPKAEIQFSDLKDHHHDPVSVEVPAEHLKQVADEFAKRILKP